MNILLKKAALAAALATVSLSAHAIEANITLRANVDPSLALLKSDGTPLTDAAEMSHNPISGLTPFTESVRIFSNDVDADVEVRLGHAAELVATAGAPGTANVPLSVTLNNRALTTTTAEFLATDLFPGSNIPGASIEMPLRVAQTTQAPITAKGYYEGVINIVLNQKP